MSTSPASPFAALLRRSKFASYDPKINQVYASFGGDASRGHFGLKRPLALRRRNAHITVAAVDSREQQTEWTSAEPQNRWVRMWDEVGIFPELSQNSPWKQKLGQTGEVKWMMDSEFGEAAKGHRKLSSASDMVDEPEQISEALPNTERMSEKEFEKYLRSLREMRPAFRQFVEAAPEVDASQSSLWMHSQKASQRQVDRFLGEQAYEQYNSKESNVIEQQPHRNGGLNYTRSSHMQNYLLTEPQPGRILTKLNDRSGTQYRAHFAGTISWLHKEHRDNQDPLRWEQLAAGGERNGVTQFRLTKAELINAPATAGLIRQGLGGAAVETQVQGSKREKFTRSNPHRIGSKQYVAQGDNVKAGKLFDRQKRASFDVSKPSPQAKPADLLQKLEMIIQESPDP